MFSSCRTKNASTPVSDDKFSSADTLTLLNENIASDSLKGDLYNLRAQYYLRKEDFNLALHDVNKALTLNPGNVACLITLSDIYLQMGKADYARETLNKASDSDPLNPLPLLKLARLHLIMKNYPFCHEYIKQVLNLDNNNAEAYFINGYAWLEAGDTAKAIRDFQMSVQKDQTFFNGYVLLGSLYSGKDNHLAASYFSNALALQPKNTDVLYNIALRYQNDSLFDVAEKYYVDLLSIDSAHVNANYNLGFINLIHREDFAIAIRYFTRAFRYDSNFVDAIYNRGLCYEILNEIDNANKDYQTALEIDATYTKAIEGLNRLDNMIRK
jgi:tetratricopeptide (TPR) repeat protein